MSRVIDYINIGSIFVATLSLVGCDGDENQLPTARFSYAVSGFQVQFTDKSTDCDGAIVALNWSFGDGVTSTRQNPNHTYDDVGEYEVLLEAVDNREATDTKSLTISVPAETHLPDYVVYSDSGIAEGSDIWTWAGHLGTFDALHQDKSAPEGNTSFITKCSSSYLGRMNYAGWGVFLVNPSEHTVDLSGYKYLKFWVKSMTDLKVEIQLSSKYGNKHAVQISSCGWDGSNTWQELSIPVCFFTSHKLLSLFGVFMITVEYSDVTFLVDHIRWAN